jgi:hypothetical protein
MSGKEAYKAACAATLDNLILHCRASTVGKVNKSNVHGWKKRGWKFLHNGSVSGFAGQGIEQDKSDTLKFFEEFVQGMGESREETEVAMIIEDMVQVRQFWGRAMLLDEQSDKLYLVGDWELYIVDKQYVVLSSTAIGLDKIQQVEDIHGFYFPHNAPSGLRIEHKQITGIGVIDDWSTEHFMYRYLQPLRTTLYAGSSRLFDSRQGWMDDDTPGLSRVIGYH